MLALSGCGSSDSGTAEPTEAVSVSESSSSSAEPTLDAKEQITPAGIAAIVLEHLGSDAVQQFLTYEPEPGSVSVVVRLRDSTPNSFGIQVYSPEQAEMFGPAGDCSQQPRRGGESECRVLGNGTTVTTSVSSQGFSDDNVDGMVISGTVITPEDGGALAMYESYDDSPVLSVADLEGLLTDPRLAWLTDPAVNEAGEGIDVEHNAT